MTAPDSRIAVVVITRDRRALVVETLAKLAELPERPAVTVVDNASTDGTPGEIRRRHPGVNVVRLPVNAGAAGRNCGVAVTPARYVAFSDDDSWWAPGALARAAGILDDHPRAGLLAARVVVNDDQRLDPSCAAMEASPLAAADGPGPAVLGFVACGAVVRRRAFLDAGGFRLGYGVGGEEELLAVDLAAAGWTLSYCPELVAHHHPATFRPSPSARRRLEARNALRTAWMRRRPYGAVRRTLDVARASCYDPAIRQGMSDAVGDLGWIWRERAPVAPALERQLALLDSDRRS